MAKYKFRLLAGGHAYNAGTDQNPKIVRFRAGDIIETDTELDSIYNSPGSIKFERMEHVVPDTEESLAHLEEELKRRKEALKKKSTEVSSEDAELDNLPMNKLQEIANANGIDVRKAKNRAEVLAIVKEALVSA